MMGIKSVKITCDGAVHNLGETLGATASARWYQLLAGSPAAAIVIGGPDCDTEGFPLVSGAGELYPNNGAEMFNLYEADQIFYKGAVNDILYVLYPTG